LGNEGTPPCVTITIGSYDYELHTSVRHAQCWYMRKLRAAGPLGVEQLVNGGDQRVAECLLLPSR